MCNYGWACSYLATWKTSYMQVEIFEGCIDRYLTVMRIVAAFDSNNNTYWLWRCTNETSSNKLHQQNSQCCWLLRFHKRPFLSNICSVVNKASNQEEPDTKTVLHALDASHDSGTRDTDVILLLIHFGPTFYEKRIFSRTSKKWKYYSVNAT